MACSRLPVMPSALSASISFVTEPISARRSKIIRTVAASLGLTISLPSLAS